MNNWEYNNPVNIIFSESSISEICCNVGSKKALLICSDRFYNTKYCQQLLKRVPDICTFTNIETEPSLNSCSLAIQFAEKQKSEIIICIGGGSVIDTAKAVRLSMMVGIYSIDELLTQNYQCEKRDYKKIDFIVLPTTHGTGSELTKWATIWDKKEKKKFSLSDDKNYPDLAIYDTSLFKTMPQDVALISTLDSLSHSFEALWNKNSNPVSDSHAINAIRLIAQNIDKLSEFDKFREENVIKELVLANIHSGLAFSNTKTAIAHSISYPLTSLYGIPHGIACSLTLDVICKIIERDAIISKKIEDIFNDVEYPYKDIHDFWLYLKKYVVKIIPFNLEKYGVERSELIGLVSKCFNRDRIGNFPISIDEADIHMILKNVY